MKHYIPTNKATGVSYQPITEEEKLTYEADPILKGKYTFKPVDVAASEKITPKPTEKKEKAPAPIEAKAVSNIPEGDE